MSAGNFITDTVLPPHTRISDKHPTETTCIQCLYSVTTTLQMNGGHFALPQTLDADAWRHTSAASTRSKRFTNCAYELSKEIGLARRRYLTRETQVTTSEHKHHVPDYD